MPFELLANFGMTHKWGSFLGCSYLEMGRLGYFATTVYNRIDYVLFDSGATTFLVTWSTLPSLSKKLAGTFCKVTNARNL